MPTITPDPINAATPPDGELVLNVPTEIRALKARVNALAGVPADTANYYRKNLLDNGSFQLTQRRNNLLDAVSYVYTTAAFFFYDRWACVLGAGVTATIAGATSLSKTAPTKRMSYMDVTSVITPQVVTVYQRVVSARQYEAKTLTLSALVDVPAAVLSAGAVQAVVSLNYGTGGTPAATVTLGTYTISTSGEQIIDLQVSMPTSVDLAEYGTNGDDYIQVAFSYFLVQSVPVKFGYVQLEEGSAPSPFELLTYAEELERCAPHFQCSYSQSQKIGEVTALGQERFQAGGTDTTPHSSVRFPESMRAAPTVKLYSPVTANSPDKVYKETATAGDVAGTSTATSIGTKGFSHVTLGAAAIAAHYYTYHWTADAEQY
jgi:hypothetical protein